MIFFFVFFFLVAGCNPKTRITVKSHVTGVLSDPPQVEIIFDDAVDVVLARPWRVKSEHRDKHLCRPRVHTHTHTHTESVIKRSSMECKYWPRLIPFHVLRELQPFLLKLTAQVSTGKRLNWLAGNSKRGTHRSDQPRVYDVFHAFDFVFCT